MKRKLKPRPLDRSTVSRIKREKRCFDGEHASKIEAYAVRTAEMASRISFLEDEIRTIKINTVDRALLEEHEKTAFHKGLHEGQTGKEEELRKDRRCFDKMHGFVEGKTMMNLSFGEILSLFSKLAMNPMSGGVKARITVFVPKETGFSKMSEEQAILLVKGFLDDNKTLFRKGDA